MKTWRVGHDILVRIPIVMPEAARVPYTVWDSFPPEKVHEVFLTAGSLFSWDDTAENGPELRNYCAGNGMLEAT